MEREDKLEENAMSNYFNQLKRYNGIDSMIAFGVFLMNISLSLLAATAIKYFAVFTHAYVYLISGMHATIMLTAMIFICMKRKQPLSTIGITKNGIGFSLLFGILGCTVIVMFKGGFGRFLANAISEGGISFSLKMIYQLLFIAIPEEVTFRGYIGTRMYGKFNSSFPSTLSTGVLWAFAHVPFQMVIQGLSLGQYLSANWQSLAIIVILHFMLQWGYKKTNSLVTPVLWHLLWNVQ